jgi:integrase
LGRGRGSSHPEGRNSSAIIKTPSSLTVAALFDRYAREVSPGKGGARWELVRLNKLARDFPMAAVELDAAAVAEWRDRRLTEVSPSSVNRELNLISAVFTRAIKEWRLPVAVNPVHAIQRPPMPQARRRRLSDTERAAILTALGWDGQREPVKRRQWVAWSFCLALETMMRQGEILRIAWQHVHTERRFIHLPKTKNGEHRDVPLLSRAAALFALRTPRDGDARVVPVDAGTFGRYFHLAAMAAGVDGLHFHDSRREALTRTAERLPNIAELARASGHRGTRSLMIYYHPSAEDIAKKLG